MRELFFRSLCWDAFADASAIDARLRRRPTRAEAFALALNLAALAIFLWLDIRLDYRPFDYHVYVLTAQGNLRQFYYADWSLPFFWLWAKIPFYWGFALWSLFNIAGVFWAARVFGGRASLALLTFQMFYGLFLGQIVGLLVGALALGWWALAHRRWNLAGLGFWIASTKFQIGLPYGLLLLLMAPIDRRARLRVLVVPAALTLASFVVFPAWPLSLWERIRTCAPYDWGSISLWRWIGAWALLLGLPLLLLPRARLPRLLGWAAAFPLMAPYFQQADLPVLYVLPIGWLPWLLGNLGFLFFRYTFDALSRLWIVPLSLYLAVIASAILSMRQKRQRTRDARANQDT